MIRKKLIASLLTITLIAGLSIRQTQAHDSRIIMAGVIGAGMTIGGVVNLCKKESKPKTGIFLILSGLGIGFGGSAIAGTIDQMTRQKNITEQLAAKVQNGISSVKSAAQNPAGALESLGKEAENFWNQLTGN